MVGFINMMVRAHEGQEEIGPYEYLTFFQKYMYLGSEARLGIEFDKIYGGFKVRAHAPLLQDIPSLEVPCKYLIPECKGAKYLILQILKKLKIQTFQKQTLTMPMQSE